MVMSASGKCRWQYLGTDPPPKPIINMAWGLGLNSRKPIIARV